MFRWGFRYNNQELEVLHADATSREVAEKLGRSPHSINIKRQRVGIARSKRRPWTTEEIQWLQQNAPFMHRFQLAKGLSRHDEVVREKLKEEGIICLKTPRGEGTHHKPQYNAQARKRMKLRRLHGGIDEV